MNNLQLFWSKVIIPPGDGCWLYAGKLDPEGYGVFGRGVSLPRRAHRISYSVYKGFIPTDQVVRHSCDVRSCVNPDHLFVGSQDDNVQDCIARGRRRVFTDDQRRALSIRGLGDRNVTQPRRMAAEHIGKKRSSETSLRMSRALGGCSVANQRGEVFPHAAAAAKALGLDSSSVIKVLKGKLRHTKGHQFTYVAQPNPNQ